MLLFKKKFIELIRNGTKTQTIRLWDRRRMRAGQRSFIPGIGYITISDVQEVELQALTDADAVPDGFETADALRMELHTLYADRIQRGWQAFRVCFAVCSPQEQKRIKAEKKKAKAKTEAVQLENRQKKSVQHVHQTLNKLKRLAVG